ncbi:3-hydroxyacyl-CoA dehydrogenase family protein [Rhodopseudomonas boonkerdii]|jgi:3-hydroxybutyryl-CoA dehydrogenase|uniref:3-hydroxyacyl-CoA dehydrogenase family protein n=1 Tax=Rhodopseudomonas boonkerdii TaxID=475937 RepID=UPI001E5682C9|nr:3-hydroxyacyl-CoA dehydrogenase family protein [Rhodopseudomonas boonkerdii]UGV28624.1 3-hydroxyacyl-CoA dehydrogenase family protein [Rhodopseudomonas boonkerdii]
MSKTIKTVGVCGAAGTMGAGIALVAARAGYRTISFDMKGDALEKAGKQSAAFLDKSVARGKLEQAKRDEIIDNMSHTTDIGELGACDMVIEAIFEDLSVKRDLMKRLDEACSDDTIFASNTSTLSITQIASGSKRPERVVGMHFCLPAQLMKLIEMSPGILTSDETFQTAWDWTKSCGQIPVKTQDKPGFILNALLVPFNNDAIRAVEAGVASAEDVDKAIKVGLGYKMGPLELIDLIGLDTQVRLCEAFYPITLDPRAATPPLLSRMVAAGLLGRKSGRGFFNYEGNAMFGA